MISTFCFCCEFLYCSAFLQSTLEALKSHEEHLFSAIVLVGSLLHLFLAGVLVGLLFLLPFFASFIFVATRVVEFLLMDSLLHRLTMVGCNNLHGCCTMPYFEVVANQVADECIPQSILIS